MRYFTPSQFRTAYALLSENAQEALDAEDAYDKMLSAFSVCGVVDEKKQKELTLLFNAVFYALVTEEEVVTEVRGILSCTESAAKQLVDKVHEALFKDIAEDLRKTHERIPKEALAFSPTPPVRHVVEAPPTAPVVKSSDITSDVESDVGNDIELAPYLKDPAIQARFQKLPPSVRAVIQSKELGDVFRSAVATFSLTPKQKTILGTHATAVLAGTRTVQLFREKFAQESELPAQTLEKLLGVIEQGMFRPVRSAILKVLEQKG